nr:methionine synthase [Flexivirga meconopsidis]
MRTVRELYDDKGIPYLPELPGRGPGADLIGRTAALLVELPVDLQPSGWRLTDAPGRDVVRAGGFLRQDLDELAEVYDGYSGPLKLQVCGPWTLAATVSLPRGERAVTDPGATRDLIQSLAAGVRDHVSAVQRLVPGADLIVQWDEPSLPAVLAGRLPTASGFGRVRAVEPIAVRDGLAVVTESIAGQVNSQVLHCCAPDVPVPLVRQLDGLELAIDVALLKAPQWDGVAELVESGRRLWAGIVPTDSVARHPGEHVDPFVDRWRRVGLETRLLDAVVVTPACGLAGAAPAAALAIQRLSVEAADLLTEAAQH